MFAILEVPFQLTLEEQINVGQGVVGPLPYLGPRLFKLIIIKTYFSSHHARCCARIPFIQLSRFYNKYYGAHHVQITPSHETTKRKKQFIKNWCDILPYSSSIIFWLILISENLASEFSQSSYYNVSIVYVTTLE